MMKRLQKNIFQNKKNLFILPMFQLSNICCICGKQSLFWSRNSRFCTCTSTNISACSSLPPQLFPHVRSVHRTIRKEYRCRETRKPLRRREHSPNKSKNEEKKSKASLDQPCRAILCNFLEHVAAQSTLKPSIQVQRLALFRMSGKEPFFFKTLFT